MESGSTNHFAGLGHAEVFATLKTREVIIDCLEFQQHVPAGWVELD